jgi:hypothetical protein
MALISANHSQSVKGPSRAYAFTLTLGWGKQAISPALLDVVHSCRLGCGQRSGACVCSGPDRYDREFFVRELDHW